MLHNGLWHIRNKTKPIRLEGHNALFCRLLYVCTCAELVILGSASAACAENMDLAKALQQKLMSQARTRPKGQTQHAQNDWDGLVNILIYIYTDMLFGLWLGVASSSVLHATLHHRLAVFKTVQNQVDRLQCVILNYMLATPLVG